MVNMVQITVQLFVRHPFIKTITSSFAVKHKSNSLSWRQIWCLFSPHKMPHSWQLTWWIPFSVEQICLPLIIYFAIWKCLKLFIVTTDVSIFLQLIIIINALFIFIFIVFVTINTIIVMLIFTFKVYFLNFSRVPLVCVNLPDRFF